MQGYLPATPEPGGRFSMTFERSLQSKLQAWPGSVSMQGYLPATPEPGGRFSWLI